MKIANRAGLSPALVTCVSHILNDYDREGADFSTTQIPDPPRLVTLVERHHAEIEVDVQDVLFVVQGQLMHQLLAAASPEGSLAEKRFFVTRTIAGADVTIGGTPDVVVQGGDMEQYKYTSARSWMSGVKDEWVMSENIYRYMIASAGINVRKMWLTMLFRDWHQSDFVRNPREYPAHAVEKLPIEPWPMDKIEMVMDVRLRSLLVCRNMEDEDLPLCSPEERWQTADKWNVRKRGNQRATKCYTAADGGNAMATLDASRRGPEYMVEHIPGESKRCAFCFARSKCSQYQAMQATEPPPF